MNERTRTYGIAMALNRPVARWGRLEVSGLETLRAGACIGVFPEGTRSRGKVLRARSGVGRLALEVPEAHVSLVAIEGTSDLTGFPRRPRLRVSFFDPAGGQPREGEDPGELSARLLAEIRELVPPSISYRKRAAAADADAAIG
jgi:1-acyl-sn-glycerol-3-phosphate acyltransferase